MQKLIIEFSDERLICRFVQFQLVDLVSCRKICIQKNYVYISFKCIDLLVYILPWLLVVMAFFFYKKEHRKNHNANTDDIMVSGKNRKDIVEGEEFFGA